MTLPAGDWVGSSPRLRGTRIVDDDATVRVGIIPALAGNTGTANTSSTTSGDHPRACGEHVPTQYGTAGWVGSSPRLRGTLQNLGSVNFWSGIIPALAGNTSRWRSAARSRWDHPRACGEHYREYVVKSGDTGSSPRLRGTLPAIIAVIGRDGIIPALAGNTSSRVLLDAGRWDHPRACGEHCIKEAIKNGHEGSSPRLRGTHANTGDAVFVVGIIPALAGNTSRRATARLISRDHPRACGEHAFLIALARLPVGSSPRLRGTRRRARWLRAPRGIIPALAGNT
ncbi:hypothetical protein PG22511B_1304 [Bifidobacterium pseudolongum subsp. globosum]|nr:hypothetical protein PG22511B_1304 [Bifidobacterium pseudolongum subsp. globosum]